MTGAELLMRLMELTPVELDLPIWVPSNNEMITGQTVIDVIVGDDNLMMDVE